MSHRVEEEWLGGRVQTLEDLLRPGLFAVCVGINPSTMSVELGHYYQGRLGRQFFDRLRHVGLLPRAATGWEDDVLFEGGVGFTDIVKRATARADEVTPTEFEHGRPLLRRKLVDVAPTLVIFTFPKTARRLFGSAVRTGFFQTRDLPYSECFAMPGPYEQVARRDLRLDDLARFIAGSAAR